MRHSTRVPAFWFWILTLLLPFCTVLLEAAPPLGRGLVALANETGTVTVSWRFLTSDPSNAAFHVYRRDIYESKEYGQITTEAIATGTTFIDSEVTPGHSYRYQVRLAGSTLADGPEESAYITALDWHKPYVSITFSGDYQARSVGLGDLNGDGCLDYVIKQPNFNTDPYHRSGYWKRSPEPFKLEAYDGATGRLIWSHDLGWAIETGTWYSPYVVIDLDGDGYAEVYTKTGEGDPREIDGRVLEGPEYLAKLDGRTGKLVDRRPWLSREGWNNYNGSMRNMLAVAYLDGKKPSLIMQRGTYDLMKTVALDEDLQQIWSREARNPHPLKGPGTHGLIAADVDDDGKDELILGSTALDDNGSVLWATGLGHPDVCFVADIAPENPGLEVFYGVEPKRPDGAVCLVSAKDGRILWKNNELTKHVHSKGMIGDIDPNYPGIECYAGEQDGSRFWLYAADGTLLSSKSLGTLSPLAVWWDNDPQKELLIDEQLSEYAGDPILKVEGRPLAVADCLGDWREEIITSLPGELRIYSPTSASDSRRVWLMEDRQYRLGVVTSSMGYYREPQLSGGLSK